MSESDDASRGQRITRFKRKMMITLLRFPALEYDYKYPMLAEALQVDTPAESRASAALLYAQQILREEGLNEIADRIKKIRIEDRKRGTPATLWNGYNRTLLVNSLTAVFLHQRKISVAAACRQLAACEPWLAERITESALRNEFNRLARHNNMTPKKLAQNLAEAESVSRNE